MSFCVVDLLKIVDIEDNDSEFGSTVHLDLGIKSLLIDAVSISVLDAGKRIDIGFDPRLCQTPAVFLFLTDLSIDIVDTDDQTSAVHLINDRSLHLYITGLIAAHHETVAQCKDIVLADFFKNIIHRKCSKHSVLILGIDQLNGILPEVREEILSLFRHRKCIKSCSGSILTVLTRVRLNNINAKVISGQGTDPAVGYLLLLHLLSGLIVLHLLINIRDTQDNESVIVLHPRDIHADILRLFVNILSECHLK